MRAFSFFNPAYIPAKGASYAALPSNITNITFTTVAGGLVESPTGKWGSAGYGLSSLTMPASTACRIYADFNEVDTYDAVIGCDTENSLEQYPTMTYGIFCNSTNGNYSYLDSGSAVGSGVAAVAGDKYGVDITAAGVITSGYLRSGSWNILFTYSSNSALKYIKTHIINSVNYTLNPKGTNLV